MVVWIGGSYGGYLLWDGEQIMGGDKDKDLTLVCAPNLRVYLFLRGCLFPVIIAIDSYV